MIVRGCFQVSCTDYGEYKNIRASVKRAIDDVHREWGAGAEWTVVFIRPFSADAQVMLLPMTFWVFFANEVPFMAL